MTQEAPAKISVRGEDVVIRRAVRDDCKRMYALIVELAIYEKAPNEVTVTLDAMEEAGFGTHPVWGAFVAEWHRPPEHGGGTLVIGMALHYYRYSTWKGRMLYLEDFVVSEMYRGAGVGARLFERVIRFAKEDGCSGMIWQALDWNEPALNFYRKYDAHFDPGWVNCRIDF